MIFVTAQPDELMFMWQTEIQLLNYTKLGVDLANVYVLVGTKEEKEKHLEGWDKLKEQYPNVNILFFKDRRDSKGYAPSIRPFLLKRFFTIHEDLQEQYMYYCDSDTVLTELPAFEAMQDDRWHISKADYISWNYIEEKKSPSLMRDMLSSVGIDEETVKAKGQEVGGVQYFIYGTTPEFWNKVEQDCERMQLVHHNSANFNTYRKEFFLNKVVPSNPLAKPEDLNDWLEGKTGFEKWDFQVWCTDMWCILWNAYLEGVDVYVNPELDFIWPKHEAEELLEHKIYHDTSIERAEEEKDWFRKGQYKYKSPFGEDHSKKGYFPNGQPAAQRYYIELIDEISLTKELDVTIMPEVSCVMTTYGRFECVERSIACWLNQTYPNKELIIFNTADVPLVLSEELKNKNIRVINESVYYITGQKFTNVGQVRESALRLALGEYYICWDDDDFYMPFHIENGMKYIIKNKKKAYKPMRSFWSPDGGTTLEYATNSMEASCIIKIEEIRKHGFKNSNGAEHLSWMQALLSSGDLDENYNVFPFESYLYLWGEEIASHKQSGSIEDPNCFENHKAQSQDFGVRPLSFYSPIRMKLWYNKILAFVARNSEQEEFGKLYEIMKSYIY